MTVQQLHDAPLLPLTYRGRHSFKEPKDKLDESHLGLSSHGHIDPRGKVGHPRSPLGNLTY